MDKKFLTAPAGMEFRPVSFYFLNHVLEESELRRQIREMADKGFGGAMLHPRDGLKTPYLTGEFARAVEVCLDEAKKCGMQIWLYDENHYPSGPAGDLLYMETPDRTQKSIAPVFEKYVAPFEEIDFDRPDGFDVPGGRIRLTGDKFYQAIETSLISGKSSVYNGKRNFPGDEAYICVIAEFSLLDAANFAAGIYAGAHSPDCFDADLTDEFINITHKFYADRFGKDFGKHIPGIFADNFCPNFGIVRRSAPWGKDFGRRFENATDMPVESVIPALFSDRIPDFEAKRIAFWDFFGKESLKNYYHRITAFCRQHNLMTTGHLCLEDGMAEHVRQIGDYFEVMRGMALTAVDQLGPVTKGDPVAGSLENDIEDLTGCIRNTASAALWQGNPRVMCESFGLASAFWDLDLLEMRRISGWLFAQGVDLFVPHGLYYSIAGHRKWECTPDHLHNGIWHHYRAWSDWIGKLCQLSANSLPQSKVLVYYPVTALRATIELGVDSAADRDKTCLNHGEKSHLVQQTFRKVLRELSAAHIQYEVIDDASLAAFDSDGSCTLPGDRGKMKFDAIVIPRSEIIPAESCDFLRKFSGRKLFVDCKTKRSYSRGKIENTAIDGELLSVNETVAALKNYALLNTDTNAGIVMRKFSKDDTDFTVIFNSATAAEEIAVTVPDDAVWFKVADNSFVPAESGKITLLPAEIFILVENSGISADVRTTAPADKTIPANWQISAVDSNFLRIPVWQTEYRGLKKYHTASFEIGEVPDDLTLMLDWDLSPNEIKGGRIMFTQILVNGQKVPPAVHGTILDRNIWECDIAALALPGRNHVEIIQDGYLMKYEKPIPPLLLAGNFTVRDGIISAPAAPGWGDTVTQGYRYYCGRYQVSAEAALPDVKNIELTALFDNISVEVSVNGTFAGYLLNSPGKVDLSKFAGQNVRITLTGAVTPHNLWENDKEPVATGFAAAPEIKYGEI